MEMLFDLHQSSLEHFDAAGQCGIEIVLVDFELPQTDVHAFSECSKATQEFRLHSAHVLDQPILRMTHFVAKLGTQYVQLVPELTSGNRLMSVSLILIRHLVLDP